MRIAIGLVASLLVAAATGSWNHAAEKTPTAAASSRIGSLAGEDLSSVPGACECELYRGTIRYEDFHRIAAERQDRVFQTRKERALGFVKLDGTLVRLDLADRKGGLDCRAKSQRVERWEAGGTTVVLDLRVTRSGEEACWYQGHMTVTTEKRSETIPVTGACGC